MCFETAEPKDKQITFTMDKHMVEQILKKAD